MEDDPAYCLSRAENGWIYHKNGKKEGVPAPWKPNLDNRMALPDPEQHSYSIWENEEDFNYIVTLEILGESTGLSPDWADKRVLVDECVFSTCAHVELLEK